MVRHIGEARQTTSPKEILNVKDEIVRGGPNPIETPPLGARR